VIGIGGLFHHALFLGFLSRAFRFRSLLRLFLARDGLTALFVGSLLRGLVGRSCAALLVLDALALFDLALLCRKAFAFRSFAFLALFANRTLLCITRFFLGAANRVELFLLFARLLLEHVALDIRPLLSNLDVDRSSASLAARELELALRFPVQSDTPRRGIGRVLATVIFLQVRQQLELRILADDVIGSTDLDARLVELLHEPIDGDLQYFREIRDRDFRHACLPQPFACSCSNQWARAAMISFAARCASSPAISLRSSTACSARSSRVTTPRLASSSASVLSIPSRLNRSSAGSAWSMTSSLTSAFVINTSRARERSSLTISGVNSSMPLSSLAGT
jgi:hypothetical protein